MSPLISTMSGASARGYVSLSIAEVYDYNLIEKRVISSNSTSFTLSNIPGTYKHLQIFATLANTGSAGPVNTSIYFNGDTTGSNYQRHYLQNSFANGIQAGGSSSATFNYMYSAGTTYSDIYSTSHINIYDYASTVKYKSITNIAEYLNNGRGSGIIQGFGGIYSGLWKNNNAITSITFEANDNQIASGSIIWLYGIKG